MKKEIFPLTTYRFLAAFYVFFFHIQIYWPVFPRGAFGRFLSEGSSGMSMFFVLSGFVLSYSYSNGIFNYKDYAFNRFSRIYPSYFLAAFVTIPWLFTSIGIYGPEQTGRYLFVLFSNIFMLQAWMPQMFAVWNDGGSWSLSVEMFFYALFPFLINFLKNKTNKQLFVALVCLYIATSLPGFSWVLFTQYTSHLVYYCTPIYRLPEFMIGLICGLLYIRGLRIAHPTLCAILCVICFYRFLAWGPDYGFTAMTHNYITIPLIAICISALANLSTGVFYKIMANPVMVYLGKISYSFYSFQAVVLMSLIAKHDALVSKFPLLADNRILGVVAFLVLIVISAVSYHFVENKFRIYLNNLYAARKKYQPAISNAESLN